MPPPAPLPTPLLADGGRFERAGWVGRRVAGAFKETRHSQAAHTDALLHALRTTARLPSHGEMSLEVRSRVGSA